MSLAGFDTTEAPDLDADPFALAALTDPYPWHHELREAAPVVRLRRYGVWAVGRYAEAQAIANDWQRFCSSAGVGLSNYRTEEPWRRPGLLLENDPPEHTRARAVLSRILSPAAVRQLRAEFEIEAERFVERLVARASFDAVSDLAAAYPLKVFPDAVGLPDSGRDRLLPYGNMIFNAFGPRNDLFHDTVSQAEQFTDWVNASCARASLRPGSFGAQIYEAADAGELTPEEAPRLVRAFLSAGLDTTVSAIGNAIHLFATNPDQWRLLREDPTLARRAFEEVLRFETPFQMYFRTTSCALELSGQRIAEGEKVLVCLAAANRDPRQWPEPDRFDVKRRAAGHMSFGSGIHTCVGAVVARLEGELILSAMARRVARIELAGEPQRAFNNTLRGFKSLPVRIAAG